MKSGDHNKKSREEDELDLMHIRLLYKIYKSKIYPRVALEIANIGTTSARNTIQKANDLRINEYIKSTPRGFTEKKQNGEKGKGKFDCFVITQKGRTFLDKYGINILNANAIENGMPPIFNMTINSQFENRVDTMSGRERQKRITFLNEIMSNCKKYNLEYISNDELKTKKGYENFRNKPGRNFGILKTSYMVYPIYNCGAFPLKVNTGMEDRFYTIALGKFYKQIDYDESKRGIIVFGKNAELAYKLLFDEMNVNFQIGEKDTANSFIYNKSADTDCYFHTNDKNGQTQLLLYQYKDLNEKLKLHLFLTDELNGINQNQIWQAESKNEKYYLGTRQELHDLEFIFHYIDRNLETFNTAKPCIICFDFQEKFYRELFKKYKLQIIRSNEFNLISKLNYNNGNYDLKLITIPLNKTINKLYKRIER